MIWEVFFIVVVLFGGAFVQGVSGFGFGLIAMSFLPLIYTVQESALLVLSLSLVLASSMILQMYKHIQWRALFVLLGAAFVGRLGGYHILHTYGELDILRVFLGIFLILVVFYLFFSKKPDPDRIVSGKWLPMAAGFGGGFVGGIFAVGGPFFVFYMMLKFSDNKYAYSANLQVTFLFTNATSVALHGASGDYSLMLVVFFLVGIMSVVFGSRLGVRCFSYIPQDKIKKLAATVVALAAVNLIFFGV
ncbi:sulfite exporter TauE/SafE family protein [Salisediminibacterium halotolerans]|uniref:Probable membrane transporter protein n=1 Tax=Salisediminibacterium halotolerans TaxID=517425 RepID=A0A1H9TV03_9BACI|nr:sulfite exporter TauE/SafE family protein [Salisediminibacterium haloalkalitolerans]SES01065.1 hypothetical protein SAMN05444126_11150 [Salisediminibacterium haloalkalitolerans]